MWGADILSDAAMPLLLRIWCRHILVSSRSGNFRSMESPFQLASHTSEITAAAAAQGSCCFGFWPLKPKQHELCGAAAFRTARHLRLSLKPGVASAAGSVAPHAWTSPVRLLPPVAALVSAPWSPPPCSLHWLACSLLAACGCFGWLCCCWLICVWSPCSFPRGAASRVNRGTIGTDQVPRQESCHSKEGASLIIRGTCI